MGTFLLYNVDESKSKSKALKELHVCLMLHLC